MTTYLVHTLGLRLLGQNEVRPQKERAVSDPRIDIQNYRYA